MKHHLLFALGALILIRSLPVQNSFPASGSVGKVFSSLCLFLLLLCDHTTKAQTINTLRDVLVGMTSSQGPGGDLRAFNSGERGTAFSLRPPTTGVGNPVFTLLQNFVKGAGCNPRGTLIKGRDGYLYGVTTGGEYDLASNGGSFPHYFGTSNGTIFKMSTSGAIIFVKELTEATTGTTPLGSLVQASDGNFYGTTSAGGPSGSSGTIIKMTPAGVISVVKSLDASTGYYMMGSMIQGTDGNLYGMTSNGGANNVGTLFQLTLSGTLTVIKHFDGVTGSHPFGSLVEGTDGHFYGMTSKGGAYNVGTIFKLTTGGTLTVLKHLH